MVNYNETVGVKQWGWQTLGRELEQSPESDKVVLSGTSKANVLLPTDPNKNKPAKKTLKRVLRRAAEAIYGDQVRHLKPFAQSVEINEQGESIEPQRRVGETADELRKRLADANAEFLARFEDGGAEYIAVREGKGRLPSKFSCRDKRYDEHGDRIPGVGHQPDAPLFRSKRAANKLSRASRLKLELARELLGREVCEALANGLTQIEIANTLGIAQGTLSRKIKRVADKAKDLVKA